MAKPKHYFVEDGHGWRREFVSLRSALRAAATHARTHDDTVVHDKRHNGRQIMASCQFQSRRRKDPRTKRGRVYTASCYLTPTARQRLKVG